MARRPPQDPSDEHGTFHALRDPVGPEDRSVYVRRRIIVLLGLVAVIAAIVLMIVLPRSGGASPASNKVEVPSDVAEKPAAGSDKTGKPAVCEQSALEVVAATNEGSYGEGELPEFTLSVTNTGKSACAADLGTAGMVFTVSSGEDDVWRSTDCQTDAESLPVILKAGETLETESVQWDRTRSSTETCDITRDPVVAGGASYHVRAAVGGAETSDTVQFMLY